MTDRPLIMNCALGEVCLWCETDHPDGPQHYLLVSEECLDVIDRALTLCDELGLLEMSRSQIEGLKGGILWLREVKQCSSPVPSDPSRPIRWTKA